MTGTTADSVEPPREPTAGGASDSQSRLGVLPAAIVACSEEQWGEARRALRVLYVDFLTGGGLERLKRQRGGGGSVEPDGQEVSPS